MALYDFQEEQPSQDDWGMWVAFWQQYALDNFAIPHRLGKWMLTSHQIYDWYYREDAGVLLQRIDGGVCIYGRQNMNLCARSTQVYKFLSPALTLPNLSEYKPCLATRIMENSVYLGQCGPQPVASKPWRQVFLTFL